ncbi:MAG: SDR family oxidoreductase [bacterium]|nr:hypothetical protein [Deltaproteobacteria bacterium]MCP4906643.1 SDR family oxidoreductase [bacterium]
MGREGGRLNAIAPGTTEAALLRGAVDHPVLGESVDALPNPLGRRAEPEEIARAICFLLSETPPTSTAACCGRTREPTRCCDPIAFSTSRYGSCATSSRRPAKTSSTSTPRSTATRPPTITLWIPALDRKGSP